MLEVVVRRAPAHALIVEAAALAGNADAGGGKEGAVLALAHALIVEGAALAGDADAGGGKEGAVLAFAHAVDHGAALARQAGLGGDVQPRVALAHTALQVG